MICVLGVFNADLKFLVDRFPAAGETLHGLSFEVQPGGKGFNQAVACRRANGEAGSEVFMLTHLGEDNFAQLAKEVMARENINASRVTSTSEMPTGTAMIMVEKTSAQNMIVVAPGAPSILDEQNVSALSDVISASKIFITNLEVPIVAAATGLRVAHGQHVTTILDPAPACELPDEIYRHTNIITPNESEAGVLVGFDIVTLEDGERAGKVLCERGVDVAIITMGDKGVVAVSGENVIMMPAFEAGKVVDTTGAGDAFNGCFASHFAQYGDLEHALIFASAGAALCVGQYGAADAMPEYKQIEAFLDKFE